MTEKREGRSSREEGKTATVLLGLGANLGDRVGTIRRSLELIGELPGTTLRETSPLYLTPPYGPPDQPEFINCAARIDTSLSPSDLLAALKGIEQTLGRKGRERWREREIDIDILFYGDLVLHNEGLHIPHPELHKRNFVLIPLADIAPEFRHPVLKKSVREMREATDERGVVRWKEAGEERGSV